MAPPGVVARPHWDKVARKLWLGEKLVKRYRRPAPVAEAILDAFEQEGWNEHIDDPLTPLPHRRQAARLRCEIEALNRRLDEPLIRFVMDGSGEGVCWEPK